MRDVVAVNERELSRLDDSILQMSGLVTRIASGRPVLVVEVSYLTRISHTSL